MPFIVCRNASRKVYVFILSHGLAGFTHVPTCTAVWICSHWWNNTRWWLLMRYRWGKADWQLCRALWDGWYDDNVQAIQPTLSQSHHGHSTHTTALCMHQLLHQHALRPLFCTPSQLDHNEVHDALLSCSGCNGPILLEQGVYTRVQWDFPPL